MTIYKPQYPAWSTVVRDVEYIAPGAPGDPAKYHLTVVPTNINDIGADGGEKAIGYYLKDFIGNTYLITAVNVDSNANRIEVTDHQFYGECPQSGQPGYVYQSIAEGDAEYIAPVGYRRLDLSSLDHSRAVDLEVIWKQIKHDKQIRNVYVGKETLSEAVYVLEGDSAEDCVAVGYHSATKLTTGKKNTIVGSLAGVDADGNTTAQRITDEDALTLIGYNATKNTASAITNSTAIGANAKATKSNQVVLGDSDTDEVKTFGVIEAAADDYATGGYSVLVRNTSTGRFEKVAPFSQVQTDWNQSTNTEPDYIKNKPSIPSAQIQSDWNQSSNSSLDYIKNKPTILAIGDWYDDISFEFCDVTKGTAQSWTLDIKASFAYDIKSASLETDNGTLTGCAVKIGTTAVTSLSSVSVDTTVDTTDATGANSVAVGDRVYLHTSTGYTGTPTLIRGKLKIKRT